MTIATSICITVCCLIICSFVFFTIVYLSELKRERQLRQAALDEFKKTMQVELPILMTTVPVKSEKIIDKIEPKTKKTFN